MPIYCIMTKAIGIGRRVSEAQQRHDDPFAAILDEAQGRLLFRGKVVDMARRTTEGFLCSRLMLYANQQVVASKPAPQ
jgi:uncharacterized protein